MVMPSRGGDYAGAAPLTPEEEAALLVELEAQEYIPPPESVGYVPGSTYNPPAEPIPPPPQMGLGYAPAAAPAPAPVENPYASPDPYAQYLADQEAAIGSGSAAPAGQTYAPPLTYPTEQSFSGEPIPAPATGTPTTFSGGQRFRAGGVPPPAGYRGALGQYFPASPEIATGDLGAGARWAPAADYAALAVPPPATRVPLSDPNQRAAATVNQANTLVDFNRRLRNVTARPPIPPPPYNYAAAEPDIRDRTLAMRDTEPIIGPDVNLQPVEERIGNLLPTVADQFGRFFSPVLGLPGGGRPMGDTVRRVQDVLGGMVLAEPEKPVGAAGQAGRRAGQAIDALVDPAAARIVDLARGALDAGRRGARLSAGVSDAYPGGRTLGPNRIRGQEAAIPEPGIPPRHAEAALIPDPVLAGNWLRQNVVDPFVANSQDPYVFGVDVRSLPVPPFPDVGGAIGSLITSQDRPRESVLRRLPLQPGAYAPSTNPRTPEDWQGATTRSLQLMKAYSPEDWAAQTRRAAIPDATGTPRKAIAAIGADDPARGPLFVAIIRGGAVVPVGNDVSDAEFFQMLASADEAPRGWPPGGEAASIPEPTTTAAATPAAATVEAPIAAPAAVAGTSGATLEDVAIPAPAGTGGGSSRSSGGDDTRSSGGRSGSYDRGYDRDDGDDRAFTREDFMEAANGDSRKAEFMARFANRRRRRSRRGGDDEDGMFGDGFPFNRAPSPIRANILSALGEAFTQAFPNRSRRP